MYYFARVKNANDVNVFQSKKVPTEQTHGNLYNCVFGGYVSVEEALDHANYQFDKRIFNIRIQLKDGSWYTP